jgi:hypothetical protein
MPGSRIERACILTAALRQRAGVGGIRMILRRPTIAEEVLQWIAA